MHCPLGQISLMLEANFAVSLGWMPGFRSTPAPFCQNLSHFNVPSHASQAEEDKFWILHSGFALLKSLLISIKSFVSVRTE